MSRSLSGSKGQGMKERTYWASFLWLWNPCFKHYAKLTTSIHLTTSQMFTVFSCTLRSFREIKRKNRNWVELISIVNLDNSSLTNTCFPCRLLPWGFWNEIWNMPKEMRKLWWAERTVPWALVRISRNCSPWAPTLKFLSEVPGKPCRHIKLALGNSWQQGGCRNLRTSGQWEHGENYLVSGLIIVYKRKMIAVTIV